MSAAPTVYKHARIVRQGAGTREISCWLVITVDPLKDGHRVLSHHAIGSLPSDSGGDGGGGGGVVMDVPGAQHKIVFWVATMRTYTMGS